MDAPLTFAGSDPDASAATTAAPGAAGPPTADDASPDRRPAPDSPTAAAPSAVAVAPCTDASHSSDDVADGNRQDLDFPATSSRHAMVLGAHDDTAERCGNKPPVSPVAAPSKQGSNMSQRSGGPNRGASSASSDVGSVRPMTYARQVSFGPQPAVPPRREGSSSVRFRAPMALHLESSAFGSAYQADRDGSGGGAAVNRAVMMAELRQLHQRAAEISAALLQVPDDDAADGNDEPQPSESSVRKPPPLVTRGLSSSVLRSASAGGSGIASQSGGGRFTSPNAFGSTTAAADGAAPQQRRERMKSVFFGVTSGPNSRRQSEYGGGGGGVTSHRSSFTSGTTGFPQMPISNTCTSAHHQQFGAGGSGGPRSFAARRATVMQVQGDHPDEENTDADADDDDEGRPLPPSAAAVKRLDGGSQGTAPTRRPVPGRPSTKRASVAAPTPLARARIVSVVDSPTSSDVADADAAKEQQRRTPEDTTSPDESFSQSVVFVDPDDGTITRRSKNSRRKPRDGFTEHHPLVAAADTAYIVATVLLWALSFAGLILNDETSVRFSKSELHRGYGIAMAAAHVVSIAWVVLRFFVQSRRGEWEVLATLHDIRAHYRASRWFIFDVVCAVPFDFLFWFWSPTAFFAVELRQFVRAARFASLMASSNPLEETRLWIHVVIFGSCGAFVIHTATCVFQALDGGRYSNALYLTFATMSSVGYGDVVPQPNDNSRGYAIIVMLLGLAIVAGATAFATSLLTSQNAVEAKAREKKKLLASMLDHFSIPWHEQIEIMSLFPTALDAENVRSFTELVQGMPPFIVERVEAYTRAKALAGAIPLFSELPMAVVLELAGRLQQRVCQANEVLIGAGAVNREMLFLVRGAADVVVAVSEAEEAVVTVLRAGMYFGELGLVRDEAADASVISAVPCELLALARPDYDELTAVHPTLRELFLREVLVAIPESDTLPVAVKAATQPAHDESLNRSDATDAGGASPPPPPQQAVSGPATAAVPSIPSFGSQSSSGASDERVAADLVAGPLSDDEAVAYQPPLVRAPSESDIDAGRLRRGDNDNDNDNDNDTGGGDSNEDLVNFAARSGIMTLGWEPPTPNQPLQVSPYASRTQLLQSDDGTVPVVAPE